MPIAPIPDAQVPALPPAIELVGIDKRFGGVHANRDIHLTVDKGSIHGIVGENGAGKSTLMSILYGFYQADHGRILVDGREVRIRSSADAIGLGIGMVHQQFMLVETFTVLENVILGAEGAPRLAAAEARARGLIERLARDYGLTVDPDRIVGELSVGEQQRVEILKALFRGAETLILDEPTAVLTPAEADHLFRILRRLQAEGKTVVIITHKLREIMAVTDTVSVMRRGEVVATWPTAATTVERIAEAMVGRRVLLHVPKASSVPGRTLLAVEGLDVRDGRGARLVEGVTFDVRAGEIVGIAGVAGNGQSELLETIAGIRRPSAGSIRLGAEAIGGLDPAAIRALGLAHVPEDRHRMGLVLALEAWENVMLGYQDDPAYQAGVLIDGRAVRAAATDRFRGYDVRPPDIRLRTGLFSGGNQQKIVIGREMERDPDVLLVGQPTRGVDIGAIEFIHRRLIALRDRGKAILLVSAELDEIRSLADRVLCMCGGRIVGECRPETPEADIGLMMAGVAA
ncbi:heme ABC transporter ATP-binding protein [Prosthecomicrobium hirschii]|uniref:ABC transporter ATP-binding protein n=1 Tax=Prosthecodimorpha hirschii TaxID=665126 RepID=UPI00112E4208|nr:ABC transporter ATP-binding protein [Prosthecomicrobium hirschii]TPQ51641.1 heme ABC transporter ATP-binding protein [Prosthecomicrobium hirschii]